MDGGDRWWGWMVEMDGDGWCRVMVKIDDGDGWWKWMVEMDSGDGWWRWMVEMDGGGRSRDQ